MRRPTFLISAWETFEMIAIAAISILFIRHFILQPFLVRGASMEPNFSGSDYLIVDELTYRFREPQRGDVVVFRYPKDESTFFIKRIIGLPGERIILNDDKISVFNDEEEVILDEKEYLQDKAFGYMGMNIQLADDEYFVMGDNRHNSYDSRSWGPLKKDFFVGLVRARLFPFPDLKFF